MSARFTSHVGHVSPVTVETKCTLNYSAPFEFPKHALVPTRLQTRLLRCPDQPWDPAECRVASLSDITPAGQAPGDSFVSPESVNSVASLSELLPASDNDAIRISTPLLTAVGFPSEPCSHAHPFDTSCANQWLCSTWCNRSRQSLQHTPERGCRRPCVSDVAERGCPHLRSCAARSGFSPIRPHPYRRRPACRHLVSLFSFGDEADTRHCRRSLLSASEWRFATSSCQEGAFQTTSSQRPPSSRAYPQLTD